MPNFLEDIVGVSMKDQQKDGVKYDQGKLRFDLLPWRAITALVRILTFGSYKYTPNGWKTVPGASERYLAAALRHLALRGSGEVYDKESGLRHIDHAMCNLTFLSELDINPEELKP